MDLNTLLSAIRADPADDLAWVAVADCLEERGEAERAVLTRLTHRLRCSIDLPGRQNCRGASRNWSTSAARNFRIGFRVALVPSEE